VSEEEIFEGIDRTIIDEGALSDVEDEHPFNEIGVGLLKECASYVITASSIQRPDRHLNFREAVIAGNGVRLFKLLTGFLDYTCAHQRELTEIFGRLMFETLVTIKFVSHFGDNEVLNSYRLHSFKYERRLLEMISTRIDQRGGDETHIEKRMKQSIRQMLDGVGLTESDLAKIDKNWGGKTLFEKCELLGWSDAYVAIVSGLSNAVHGTWADLQHHHVKTHSPDAYEIAVEWSPIRPQPLFSFARLIAGCSLDIWQQLHPEANCELLKPRVDDLLTRVEAASVAHERCLQRVVRV
jgi:hypothetical protein